jgi:hypothetical protein
MKKALLTTAGILIFISSFTILQSIMELDTFKAQFGEKPIDLGTGSFANEAVTATFKSTLPLLSSPKASREEVQQFASAKPYFLEQFALRNVSRTRRSIYTHELMEYGQSFVHFNFERNPFTARCSEGSVTVFKGPVTVGRCASLVSDEFVYAINDFPHCKPSPSYCYDTYNTYFKTPLDTGKGLNQPLDVMDLFLPSANVTVVSHSRIVPVLFLWGAVFPHTIKDSMPRVILALPYLQAYPEAKLLIERSEFTESFLKRIGVPESRILWTREMTWQDNSLYRMASTTIYQATEELALPHCYPGPLGTGVYASELYHALRDLLVKEPHLPEQDRNLILYIARDGGTNYETKGFMRRLDNEAAVLEKLQIKLEELKASDAFEKVNQVVPEFLRFKGNGMTMEQQISLFRRARVVFGPHGGGFYNLIFAAPGTKVIEITPDDYGKFEVARLSTVLGLDYQGYVKKGMLRNETFGDIDIDWMVSKVLSSYSTDLLAEPNYVPMAYSPMDRYELADSSTPF